MHIDKLGYFKVTGQKALVVNKIPLSLHSGFESNFSTYLRRWKEENIILGSKHAVGLNLKDQG